MFTIAIVTCRYSRVDTDLSKCLHVCTNEALLQLAVKLEARYSGYSRIHEDGKKNHEH